MGLSSSLFFFLDNENYNNHFSYCKRSLSISLFRWNGLYCFYLFFHTYLGVGVILRHNLSISFSNIS